jgi:outer membrane protein assembly factor BamB
VATVDTTTSCRAFALIAVAIVLLAGPVRAADTPQPPKLPVMPYWSVPLDAGASTGPVADGDRVYLGLQSAHVIGLSSKDGHPLWRIARDVTVPMVAADGVLFAAVGDAIEAFRGTDGVTAWLAPRIKAVTPLVVAGGMLFAVTDADVVAIRVADGQIAWRRPAGGVRHAPTVDGSRLFVGADDGRVVALDIGTGNVLWDNAFVNGGVTTLRASRGLVYAGGGDKKLHCLDAKTGREKWGFKTGSNPIGSIAVDDKRVYVSALDNVVRGLDRSNGTLRWQQPIDRRLVAGVQLAGHVVFVDVSGTELVMLFDATGARSGSIALPTETTGNLPIDVRETATGIEVFVISGSLANQWHLTMIGPAGEAAIEPFDRLSPLPGVPFLTDPQLTPIGRVLPWLVLTDPVMLPFSAIEWPVVLRDPPLVPLTTLPGIQLRPLSPVLPVRRGG